MFWLLDNRRAFATIVCMDAEQKLAAYAAGLDDETLLAAIKLLGGGVLEYAATLARAALFTEYETRNGPDKLDALFVALGM